MLNINFADNKLNAIECIMLQSEENADNIIRVFESNYEDGDDPNDLLEQVAAGLGIGASDLLPASKQRIEDTIKNYLMRY